MTLSDEERDVLIDAIDALLEKKGTAAVYGRAGKVIARSHTPAEYRARYLAQQLSKRLGTAVVELRDYYTDA